MYHALSAACPPCRSAAITAALISTNFTANAAGLQAGAIFIDDGSAAVLLDQGLWVNNTAQRGGGGALALQQSSAQPSMQVQVG